jgi:hypothetical protein
MRRILLALIAVSVLSGCNTLAQKSYQKVRVETPGVTGADCTLNTKAARYRLITPDSVLIERSPYTMTVTCEKGNHFTAVTTVEPKTHAMNGMQNILNGFVPGMAYDISARSIYDYPRLIILPMQEDPDAVALLKEEDDEIHIPVQRREHGATPRDKPGAAVKTDTSFSNALRK